MKNLRLLPLVVAIALSTSSAFAADTPNLPIDRALKIAQDYLQKSGTGEKIQIVGLTYEQTSLHAGYWYAKWSHAVQAADDNSRKETGLRIDMDGTVTRFLSAPGGRYEPPVGQRPVGARSMR
jgi:hypothetical protein